MIGPKVSIVIPVYNGSDYLHEAIASALNQVYKNIEIIVVNDGSVDDDASERIALSFADSIRYFRKENGGVASALNLGIREMAGEYFSWLSHDDLYLPRKIQAQVDLLNLRKPDRPCLVYSDFYETDSVGRITYAVYPPRKYAENSLYLLSNHLVNGCSLLIPKVCFEEAGTFDESLRSTQDYDLWFRMRTKYRFLHAAEFLVMSRLHNQQGSNTMTGHRDARNRLHIFFMDNISRDDIEQSGFSVRNYFLRRAARLEKEGLPEASGHAYGLSAANGRGLWYGIMKLYYSARFNKKVSATLYFLKLLANPKRWDVLLKIIKGRLS